MQKSLLLGAAAVACALSVSVGHASVKGDIERLTDAAKVLTDLNAAPDRGIPQDLWDKAKCVAVIPSVKKAAFIVGGEYGKGVISCRRAEAWSAPSFMLLEKGSVGFQIGGESIDLILLVMNDEGVGKILENHVALGGEASAAAGPVGRDARAMTNGQLKAQFLSYSRAQGAFAGIDLTGGALKPDNDENKEFYGKAVTSRQLLTEETVKAPAAAKPFMDALWRNMPPSRSR